MATCAECDFKMCMNCLILVVYGTGNAKVAGHCSECGTWFCVDCSSKLDGKSSKLPVHSCGFHHAPSAGSAEEYVYNRKKE